MAREVFSTATYRRVAVVALTTVSLLLVGRALVLVYTWPVVDSDNTCGALYRPDIWYDNRGSWCEQVMFARLEAVVLYFVVALIALLVAIVVARSNKSPMRRWRSHRWAAIIAAIVGVVIVGRAVGLTVIAARTGVHICDPLYRLDLRSGQRPWCDTIIFARIEAVLLYVVLVSAGWRILVRGR